MLFCVHSFLLLWIQFLVSQRPADHFLRCIWNKRSHNSRQVSVSHNCFEIMSSRTYSQECLLRVAPLVNRIYRWRPKILCIASQVLPNQWRIPCCPSFAQSLIEIFFPKSTVCLKYSKTRSIDFMHSLPPSVEFQVLGSHVQQVELHLRQSVFH